MLSIDCVMVDRDASIHRVSSDTPCRILSAQLASTKATRRVVESDSVQVLPLWYTPTRRAVLYFEVNDDGL